MKDVIILLAGEGKTRREAAAALGLNYVTFCKRAARLGVSPLFDAAEYRLRSRVSIDVAKRRALEAAGLGPNQFMA